MGHHSRGEGEARQAVRQPCPRPRLCLRWVCCRTECLTASTVVGAVHVSLSSALSDLFVRLQENKPGSSSSSPACLPLSWLRSGKRPLTTCASLQPKNMSLHQTQYVTESNLCFGSVRASWHSLNFLLSTNFLHSLPCLVNCM